MVWGALLGVAGAGMGAYGAQKKRRAMGAAQDQYQGDLDAYYARQGQDTRDFQNRYNAIDQNRLGTMEQTLQDYMSPSYGTTAGDTAMLDRAVTQAQGTGGNQLSGGAAGAWGAGLADRNAASLGRQRGVAADANMLQRVGQTQSAALSDFGLQDQRYARQLDSVRAAEQLRQALLAQQFQRMNQNAQNTFQHAQGVGDDWINVGGLVGMSGNVVNSWGGGQTQQPQGQGQSNYANGTGPIWNRRPSQ